jgi:hypothetical protein
VRIFRTGLCLHILGWEKDEEGEKRMKRVRKKGREREKIKKDRRKWNSSEGYPDRGG